LGDLIIIIRNGAKTIILQTLKIDISHYTLHAFVQSAGWSLHVKKNSKNRIKNVHNPTE
jgi:hypothetical protein